MSAEAIEITVNGESRSLPRTMTVEELIEFLSLDRRTIAVGRNAEVVQRNNYKEVSVVPGDRIDIVHFVAGG